tara:strand:+ start:548 stop:736 length:189 start_codon:yes stop_codon:yes gene_type:complete
MLAVVAVVGTTLQVKLEDRAVVVLEAIVMVVMERLRMQLQILEAAVEALEKAAQVVRAVVVL